METNYDSIAEQYQRAKQQPWRTHIECFTLMHLLGDLTGLDVLDVACGEGFYTRLIRERGAARVMGLDLSQGMIDLARQQETRHGLGISYQQGDARAMGDGDPYDLAVAAYLLNYARTRAELGEMCAGIARALKPGGRFVTVNTNPAIAFLSAPSYRKYGFETSVGGDWMEGAPIWWTFFLDDGPLQIENYHLNTAAHEDALRCAGFSQIHWHGPQLSPAGLEGCEASFWANLLEVSPVTFLECTKGYA